MQVKLKDMAVGLDKAKAEARTAGVLKSEAQAQLKLARHAASEAQKELDRLKADAQARAEGGGYLAPTGRRLLGLVGLDWPQRTLGA